MLASSTISAHPASAQRPLRPQAPHRPTASHAVRPTQLRVSLRAALPWLDFRAQLFVAKLDDLKNTIAFAGRLVETCLVGRANNRFSTRQYRVCPSVVGLPVQLLEHDIAQCNTPRL